MRKAPAPAGAFLMDLNEYSRFGRRPAGGTAQDLVVRSK